MIPMNLVCRSACIAADRFSAPMKYCSRYMVGTRGKGEVSTGTNHLGFRCVQLPGQRVSKLV